MSEKLRRFLGSTIRAVEQTKREVEAEKEREERQSDIQKSMRRAELAEKRQIEDIQRRRINNEIEQSKSAFQMFLFQRQGVYDNLDRLKSGVYAQISSNPGWEQILIDSWKAKGHRVESLSDVFKLGENIQLNLLKESIVESLKLGPGARQRFYTSAQLYNVRRAESITDLLWSMNRPQEPKEDFTGLILSKAIEQVSQIHKDSQNRIMQIMYGYSPAPPPQEQPNKVIEEILKAVNIQR